MMRESEFTMTNNDFLRRLRYALNIKDNVMVQIFKKGNIVLTREDVIDSVRSMADNVKVMNKPEGISFKCNDTDTYENIIDAIELLGVEPEVLGNMLDEKYLRD